MKRLIDRVRTRLGRATSDTRNPPEPNEAEYASEAPEPSGDSHRHADTGTLAFDPLAPDFVQDPYPLLRRLREEDPVHRSPMGSWVLTRHDDILEALADPRLGNAPSRFGVLSARNRQRSVAANVAHNIIPFLDEPAHAAPRRIISRAFRAQLKQSPPDLSAIAQELLAQKPQGEPLDVLGDYATPFSVRVLSRLLGVPAQDESLLTEWTHWFFYLFSPIPSEEIRARLDEALREFRDYFARLVSDKQRQPGADLISRMLEVREGQAGLDDAALVDTCMLLFSDGIENVDSAIANGVAALSRNPQELERLRASPELLPRAVDECLRFETPAQFIGRVALEDLELRGSKIKAQSGVLLVLASANRDPSQFERPDVFDIGRSPNPHLAFGKGRHSCIGGPLVRIEMQVALGELLAARPQWEPVETEDAWQARLGHRWIRSLSLA